MAREKSIRRRLTVMNALSSSLALLLACGAFLGYEIVTYRKALVSDEESAVERGAIIGLKLQERKVRFEVNLLSARKARLKLSSQLLKIAVRLVGQL